MSMGSLFKRADYKVTLPLGITTAGNTHAPWPDDWVQSRALETLIKALCTVCARKGVNNLLNHTLPEAGTSGSTKQVWGLPEQDSIYGRLRRLMFPAVVSTTKHSFTVSPGQGHNPCLLPQISRDTTVSKRARAHRHVRNRSTLLDAHKLCMLQNACKRK